MMVKCIYLYRTLNLLNILFSLSLLQLACQSNYLIDFGNLESSTPISLFTMTLLRGSDEEYGVFTSETATVKGEIKQKFSKSRPKSAKFWRFSGHGGSVVKESFDLFITKGTSVRGSTSFKPFSVKIG